MRVRASSLLECAGVVWVQTGWSGRGAKHVELDQGWGGSTPWLDKLGLFDRRLAWAYDYNLTFPDSI